MTKIPKGWKLIPFGQFTSISRGYNPPKSEFIYEPKEGYTRFIQIRDGSSDAYTVYVPDSPKLHLVSKEDLLLVAYRHVGKVFKGMEGAFNVALCKIEINDHSELNSDFLYYMIPTDWVKGELLRRSERALIPSMSVDHLKAIQIPLPTFSEQTRIVSRLDSLFSRIDKSITLLEENINYTKALMASVLEEVFGKLKAQLFILNDITTSIQYGYTGKALDKGEYYYLRITDIQSGKVDFSQTPFSDIPKSQIEKYKLNKGDILFARTGATAGKSYLFMKEEKSVFASYLIRVICNADLVHPNFLYWYFQSGGYWKQINENIVGAAQPNFNGSKLGRIKVPIPNLSIQTKLIEKFEHLNSEFEEIIKQQQSKLNNLKALKSSLLDRAFKGEL